MSLGSCPPSDDAPDVRHPPGARCPVARIYLDHNASTPPSAEVKRGLRAYFEGEFGNAGAAHPDGRVARSAIDRARVRIARAVGGRDDDPIVFTSGGTESNNLAVFGVADAELARTEGAPRRHVVCGTHEHLSVARPVESLEARGFRVTWIDPLPSGALDPAAFERAITDDTLLVCAMFANNETGVLQPVAEIARAAHAHGALVLSDGVCGIGKAPINVDALDCDLLSVSGHKLHAPKGIGALWTRSGVELAPVILGCGQQAGLRSGTENTMGAVGLGAAMEAHAMPVEAVRAADRVRPLRDALIAGLEELSIRPQRNGGGPDLANTCSVWFPGRDALELQARLGDLGLSVAAQASRQAVGAPPTPSHVLGSMGLDDRRATESLRFSLGSTTTREDVEAALFVVRSVLEPARLVGLSTGGAPDAPPPSPDPLRSRP
ncbi:MAG: cysteine desulfurase family protein [Planctomycetota bacterium]